MTGELQESVGVMIPTGRVMSNWQNNIDGAGLTEAPSSVHSKSIAAIRLSAPDRSQWGQRGSPFATSCPQFLVGLMISNQET
jgi:hypothetical protein